MPALMMSQRAIVRGSGTACNIRLLTPLAEYLSNPYTCFTGKGLCGVGCGPVRGEMPWDGTRPAWSSFFLLDSAFGEGETGVGDVIRSIEGQSLVLARTSLKHKSRRYSTNVTLSQKHPPMEMLKGA